MALCRELLNDAYSPGLAWAVFFLFVLIVNIVMLNLLIAIISDDYGRVQETQMATDARAKCSILVEIGFLNLFVRKYLCCHKSMTKGELKVIHRFV